MKIYLPVCLFVFSVADILDLHKMVILSFLVLNAVFIFCILSFHISTGHHDLCQVIANKGSSVKYKTQKNAFLSLSAPHITLHYSTVETRCLKI